jgi:large subunit ribosomal protein L17
MRHRNVNKILDRKAASRNALVRSLVQSVILYEKITTTKAKAKAAKPEVERAIGFGKEGTLAGRRNLLKMLQNELVVKKMMDIICPKYKDRTGGYVRIIPLGTRKGDCADIVSLELV